jgi:hypothetical protein
MWLSLLLPLLAVGARARSDTATVNGTLGECSTQFLSWFAPADQAAAYSPGCLGFC